jgi:molybdate transport system substrate-binding protein
MRGLIVLTDVLVRLVAIANPEHAPYGRAAVAAIRHELLYERVQGKFVLQEDISQAAQFDQSGSADVGVLALSLALSPTLRSSGTYVDIPESWYPPIEHAAVVLTSSRQKPLTRQFIDYLSSPTAYGCCRRTASQCPRRPPAEESSNRAFLRNSRMDENAIGSSHGHRPSWRPLKCA